MASPPISTKRDAREVLERFFDAERAYMAAGGPKDGGDFDALRSTLAPEAVMHQAANLPYGGEWRGHEGFERFFTAMSNAWSALEVFDVEYFEPADGGIRTVVSLRMVATSRATGQVMDRPMLQIVEVRDGRIHGFWPFYWDVAEVNQITTSTQEKHHAQRAD